MFGCYDNKGGKTNTNFFFNINQALKAIERRPIRLPYFDHDYILDDEEIKCKETI